MPEMRWTADEMMTIAAARRLKNGTVCFVGIGLPSAAANLARLTHAPDIVLVYESGTIRTRPSTLPLSIGDGELAETALTVVSVPEMFRYWLQAGRIDVGFLGAAQVDRFGNINSTVIGAYTSPSTRLPGGGGAPEIATQAKEVFIMLRQSPRSFVPELPFVTSAGQGRSGEGARVAGAIGAGPSAMISDFGLLSWDLSAREFMLTEILPGRTVKEAVSACGWPLKVAADIEEVPEPTSHELNVLRDLQARSRGAHE
jgi:glutaconate CoA-transferase, subunit B